MKIATLTNKGTIQLPKEVAVTLTNVEYFSVKVTKRGITLTPLSIRPLTAKSNPAQTNGMPIASERSRPITNAEAGQENRRQPPGIS